MMNAWTGHRRWVLLVAFTLVALILGTLMLLKYRESKEVAVPASPPSAGVMQVSLLFAPPEGDGLVGETREIDACGADVSECIESAIEELANGPLGDLAPTLPDTTVLKNVTVEGDTAVLDFGKEIADGLPGGSSAEMTAVYSVVDTVCYNFRAIKKVKFLLEGEQAKTLKGHLDLRQPLLPDFSIIKTATQGGSK